MKAWEYWLAFPVLCCCHTILWYCTDPWPQGGLSPSSLDWLHQIDATSDSVHARILFYFFLLLRDNCYFSIIPMQLWYWWVVVGDRTTHWRLSWVGCWTSPLSWCSQAFHSFQGAQFELGKCSTCSQRCKLPAAPLGTSSVFLLENQVQCFKIRCRQICRGWVLNDSSISELIFFLIENIFCT